MAIEYTFSIPRGGGKNVKTSADDFDRFLALFLTPGWAVLPGRLLGQSEDRELVGRNVAGQGRSASQKPNNPRPLPGQRMGCVAFPESVGIRSHPDLLGDLPLEQSEVHPSLPEMIP